MNDERRRAETLSPVKRALFEQRRLRALLEEAESRYRSPLAVIGLGCRVPGARGPAEFWQMLSAATDAIREVPAERWDVDAYFDARRDVPGKMATRWGGFIGEIDLFDARFFGIAPREATCMDPQQRLALEVAWEALEHAGQAAHLAESQTGVFLGIGTVDYLQLETKVADVELLDVYYATGFSHSVASGRIAYALGLKGPAVSVDTACSSSLVAFHLACQSLRMGECRMALAGGVNAILVPDLYVSLSQAQMMARDGRCKTFDAAADGFVRGEGCGVVVLKRLADAVADGDRVLAVVRGSAANQDGRSNGLTAPNGPSQAAVVRQALANAGVAPHEISFVETHGTGTSLGDPIEVHALGEALGEGRGADAPVWLGAVKTNLGHLEAAAGITGLIKTVLALQHEAIPANLHFRVPNPHVEWSRHPSLQVPVATVPWPRGAKRRCAGVSSFGFSGTNVHVVLEEAPQVEGVKAKVERPLQVVTLSARTQPALQQLAGAWATHLRTHSEHRLADVAFSANTGRARFEERLAVIAASPESAVGSLERIANGDLAAAAARHSVVAEERPTPVFVFTGEGAQWAGMGQELYASQPTFRRVLEECEGLLAGHLERPLRSVLYGEDRALLDRTDYAQPAVFALEYALAALWRAWGVEPAVVLGYGVGEYVAACVAGVFTLKEGLALVAARGRLMQGLPAGGGMAEVYAEEARVAAAVAGTTGVVLAAVNAPAHTVISGPEGAVDAVLARLGQTGIGGRRLPVSHAGQSPLMEPMLEAFRAVAAGVTYAAPRLTLVSSVTGAPVTAAQVVGAEYWVEQVRRPIQFYRATQRLVAEGHTTFVEVGPHPVLSAMARGNSEAAAGASWLPSLERGEDSWPSLLTSLATLWVIGVDVDWAGFDRDYHRQRLDLPTYPFQRQRYWIDEARTPTGAGEVSGRWEGIVRAARKEADKVPVDLNVHTYSDTWNALDRFTTASAVATLRQLGAFAVAGESHTATSLSATAGVESRYEGLVSMWLRRLARHGVLVETEPGRFTAVAPLDSGEMSGHRAEAAEHLAELPVLWKYLSGCEARLPEVLTGTESPLQTLFPDGSFEIADFLYRDWALARYFNGILAEAAAAFAAGLPVDRPLTVLEIGAGSGGSTASILPAMPANRCRYWYTDLSDHFMTRAAAKFATFPFIEYALLDIEKDPQEQGIPLHAFDMVIAANSLHAARDLGEALEHVRNLLRPGGLLALYEVTEHLSWFEVSVGLIEGWRRHSDGLRTDTPLLDRDRWIRVLQERGFESVVALPDPESPARVLGHHVLLASLANGAVVEAPGRAIEIVAPRRAGPSVERAVDLGARDPDAGTPDLLARLAGALPTERHALMIDYVTDHVSTVLRLGSDDRPGPRSRLVDLGVDSLMAVELRGRLDRGLGGKLSLPATLIFDFPTIDAVAAHLEHKMGFDSAEPVRRDSGTGDVVPSGAGSVLTESELAAMSDDEVEALLIRKLDGR